MIKHPLLYVLLGCCWLTACKPEVSDDYKTRQVFGPGQEDKIVEAFLSLKDSSSIELKAGTYKFDNLSIANLKHILIQGAGPDSTILDFSSQTSGGEGIRVTDVKGFTIKGMVLQNAKGDLIKINRCQDVVSRPYTLYGKQQIPPPVAMPFIPCFVKMCLLKIPMQKVPPTLGSM